jgi:hypothetical protein
MHIYYQECMALQRDAFGDQVSADLDHISTLRDLARLLQSRRYYAKAEALFNDVLSFSKRLLGDHHPMSLEAMHDMGTNLSQQRAREDKLFLAEQILEACLEMKRAVLGPTHSE